MSYCSLIMENSSFDRVVIFLNRLKELREDVSYRMEKFEGLIYKAAAYLENYLGNKNSDRASYPQI